MTLNGIASSSDETKQKSDHRVAFLLPDFGPNYMRSYTAAIPCPPPMHMVTSA